MISNGWQLVKTHDLIELVKYCIKYDLAFGDLFPVAGTLNRYITEGRYPSDLGWDSIGLPEAKEALDAAGTIAKLVLDRIQID